MKYEIVLTLKMETDDNFTSEFIEEDLMREINCACCRYELENIEVKQSHE